ncbi:hypothetical protein CYMTET_38188 [Cymbomonas tetramitiformis]|uniref:Uncharacterized protein n=1 Tax=Cymbomonas tetramitiformis TaxID=36881 RepID=A0AAE0CDY9_9CHLO|nr:hypothetical protein CYMTET_38188 [Cymbomonas tetramitiformis]
MDKFAEWESSDLDKIEIGSCLYTEFIFKAVKEDLGTEYTRVLTAAEKIFVDIHKGDHDLTSEHLQLAHSLEKRMDTTSKENPQPSTEAPSVEDRTPNEVPVGMQDCAEEDDFDLAAFDEAEEYENLNSELQEKDDYDTDTFGSKWQ